MKRYEVRGFTSLGEFVFGGTLRADDDTRACERFEALPLTADHVELYRGKRRVAARRQPQETGGERRMAPYSRAMR